MYIYAADIITIIIIIIVLLVRWIYRPVSTFSQSMKMTSRQITSTPLCSILLTMT